jgi:hypothetical protein
MLGQHFLKRRYPLHIIEEAAIKARRLDRSKLLADKKKTSTKAAEDSVILVTTYNPYDNTVRDIVKNNWDLLGKSTNSTFLHEKKLMTAYRRPKNLRDLIVRADCQIKQPAQRPKMGDKQTTLDRFLRKGDDASANSGTRSTSHTINPVIKLSH